MTALSDAVAGAPHDPGVYFFLGSGRDLLYVGKAVDLRRRLGDHARDASRTSDVRRRVLLDAVCTVRWETYDSAEAAARREVDLIVLLNPAFNAAHVEQDPDRYVVVTAGPATTSFDVTGTPTGPGCVYGTFPHLAKGATSSVAKRTNGGYTALLRLLWARPGPDRAPYFPSRISGSSPPTHFEMPVGAEVRPLLHAFLAGRSSRLLAALDVRTADVAVLGRVGLERDAVAARDFFALGPQAVRRFRLRHGLARGPVPADVMAELLEAELAPTLGVFSSGDAPPDRADFGRRAARQRQLRDRLRR